MKLSWVILLAVAALLAGGAFWLWTPDKPRAQLDAKYLKAPGDMIDIAGTRLHVRDSGPKNAPALILIHGFGSSLHTWEGWAAVLATDHRVIRFDLPGSGLSPPDSSGEYTDARSLHLIAALMDRLGLARASLVGNSIGGRIAWTFAAEAPTRVDKLVLISPDGFASPGQAYGAKPEISWVMRLMRYTLPKALLRMNLAPAYGDPSALTDEVVSRYHDLMLAPGARDALIARWVQTVRENPIPRLKRIAAPTLLLWGEKDALIPVANAADYLNAMPNASLVRLPGLGHVPHEEAPAISLIPLRAFLAR